MLKPRFKPKRPQLSYGATRALGLTSLLVLVGSLPLFIWGSKLQSLAGCDESYYALIARTMLETGNWIAPQLLGDVLFEKPPLLPWLMALGYHFGGVHVWTSRLPSIIAALGAIPVMGWIGSQYLSARATILGMVGLPLCFLWVQQGRMTGQDLPLTLLELIGIAALIAGVQGQGIGLGLVGITLGLGLLMKSAMILLAGVALLPFLLMKYRQWLLSVYFWLGLITGLGICGIWLGMAFHGYGAERVWQGLVGKVQDLGATPFHPTNNWMYYIWHIPAHGFPWTVLGLIGGWILMRTQPGPTLLLWSFPLILALELQIFPTRTHYYTLQLYPWLALLAGVTLDQVLRQWHHGLVQPLSWALSTLGLLLLALGGAILAEVPGLEDLAHHGVALIMIGLLYLSLIVIWTRRRSLYYAKTIWLIILISASVITMASIVTRPDFGNFNPALAQFQWDQVDLLDVPVDIGSRGLVDVCQALAYAYYTPNPGQWVHDRDLELGRYGQYVWLSPSQLERYGSELIELEGVVELEGWQLMSRRDLKSSHRRMQNVRYYN